MEDAYSYDIEDVLNELDVDPSVGLMEDERARRLIMYGYNRTEFIWLFFQDQF